MRSGCSTSPDPLDEGRLLASLAAVSSWSQPSNVAKVGSHHGYRQVTLAAGGRVTPEGVSFGWVFDLFAPVWEAWLASIEPGGFVRRHVDAGPYRERWHVPIECAGVTCGRMASPGVPFTVQHWEPHSVTNQTDRRRVHLILDRDVILHDRRTPFRLEEP